MKIGIGIDKELSNFLKAKNYIHYENKILKNWNLISTSYLKIATRHIPFYLLTFPILICLDLFSYSFLFKFVVIIGNY